VDRREHLSELRVLGVLVFGGAARPHQVLSVHTGIGASSEEYAGRYEFAAVHDSVPELTLGGTIGEICLAAGANVSRNGSI